MRHFHLCYTYHTYDSNDATNEATRLLVAATRRNLALGLYAEQNENPDTFHITIDEDVHLSALAIRLLAEVTPSSLEREWNIMQGRRIDTLRDAILLVRFFADGDRLAFEVGGEYFKFNSNLLEQITARNIAAGWQTDTNEQLRTRQNPVLPNPPPIYVEEQTPLMLAAKNVDSFQQVKDLLTNGANPNAYDQYGRTALVYAVAKDNLDIIDALLNAGANPMIEFELASGTLTTALRLASDQNAKCEEMLHRFAQHHEPFSPANLQPYPAINQQEIDADNVPGDSRRERWENSDDFQYRERDNGQFGSFPLHEDYSDESRADSPKDNEWYDVNDQ